MSAQDSLRSENELIQGQLEDAEEQLRSQQHTLKQIGDQIGDGAVILTSQALRELPKRIHSNLMIARQAERSDAERLFQYAMVDPSHPRCYGARVPTLMAAATAAYHHQDSFELNEP